MLANQLVYREDEAHLVVQEDNSSKIKDLKLRASSPLMSKECHYDIMRIIVESRNTHDQPIEAGKPLFRIACRLRNRSAFIAIAVQSFVAVILFG